MRNISFFLAGIAVVIAFLMFNQGCKKDEIAGKEFIIQVDSIVHPDTINAGELLTIKYYGLMGINDCFSFNRFEVTYDANLINTTAIGLEMEEDDCKEGAQFMKGKELNIYDLTEGEFTIRVNLPQNAVLESKVIVIADP